MRDSAFKRFLVSMYFSGREISAAILGMCNQREYCTHSPDYDEYWQHRVPGAIQPRFQIIAGHLRSGESVLDVGCGDGAMIDYFFRTKGVRGIGIDISAVAVGNAKKRGVDARVQTLTDFSKQLDQNTFDHVVISEVLEHLVDSEQYVTQGWSLASKTLWLTFPNIAYFPHRFRLLAGHFPVQWAVFPTEHLRFWSVPDFYFWLKQLGMKGAKMYASNGLTVFGLHKLWPNLLANQIVVQLEKA
jgi:methionine biosynthesis protein MetW